jgi:hypothetical protein
MSEPAALTFEKNDKLNLKPLSTKLEKFLSVEHDFVDGSLVVSLNAPFGSGKTTFLAMWKNDLDERRQKDDSLPLAVMLNAWENDYCGDPLLSVITGLIRAAETNNPNGQTDGQSLREAAKDIAWFTIGLANQAASKLSGIDVIAAGEFAENKKKGRIKETPDFVSLYEHRAEALAKLKITLRKVFGDTKPKAIIFIDELDRCRPDYAINYLETIKHVFDIHGLTFVLAVDYEQLGCSARSLFGHDLVFAEYFRKFVQRSLSLPEPDETGLRALCEHYAIQFIEKEDKRVSLAGVDDRLRNIVELVTAIRMTPRQIQEMFRIVGHVLVGDKERRGKLYWCIGVGVILMSVLKIAQHDLYLSIGKGKQNHRDVGKFFKKIMPDGRHVQWWFTVYISGTWTGEDEKSDSIEKIFKDLEFISADNTFEARRELGQFASGWGHHSSDRFKQIYGKIETAATFLE